MKILYLNLKTEFFNQIKAGIKPFEFRECTDFWTKRLVGRDYDFVSFACGYPKKTDKEKFIVAEYKGYEIQKITHPHFGDKEVTVFAIPTDGERYVERH